MDLSLKSRNHPHPRKRYTLVEGRGLAALLSFLVCSGIVFLYSQSQRRLSEPSFLPSEGTNAPHTNLRQCPSNAPLPASPPVPVNVWAPLLPREISQTQGWLEDPERNLNLTDASVARSNDNAVFLVELYPPSKNATIAYLDSEGSLPPPPKFARATIHHGGQSHPVVRDYLVGPLPISSATTIRALTEIYHREEIPYNVRGLSDYGDIIAFLSKTIAPLKDAIKDLFDGIVEGKDDDTFIAGTAGPWSYDGSFRRFWTSWRFNIAGSFVLPINFYQYFDLSGTDSSLWSLSKVVYHDQLFSSVQSFLESYRNGSLIRKPPPSHSNDAISWLKRTRVGQKRDLDERPGPRAVSFAGLRYRVDREKQYISWLGWGLFLGFNRDTGLSLWDIRFRGERIVYELALQDLLVQYAGHDPVQSTTAWLDRYFGIGTYSRDLLPGYDCPQEATYLPARSHSMLGGIYRKRGICVFEHDVGIPLTRHYGDLEGETGAVKSYVLTIRTVGTLGNYDYLFDYIFHLDGTIEVKVSASGYLQGGYWTPEQTDYGYKLRTTSMGSVHDHIINFKVDFDIAGQSNSFLKTTTSQEEKTLPWFDDDWGNTVLQQKITREYIKNEDEARVNYPTNFQGGYAIINQDQHNTWGNPRGYAIHPGSSPVHTTVVGSKRTEKNVNWAKYNLAVSKRKDTEPSSSSMWNLHLPGNPMVNFEKFFDGENITQEDLVLWINVGTHHLPQAEDSPNTKTNIATSSFMLTPLNYFDSDVSMETLNAVILQTPLVGEPYGFDDNGVRQDLMCVPQAPPPFIYESQAVEGLLVLNGLQVG